MKPGGNEIIYLNIYIPVQNVKIFLLIYLAITVLLNKRNPYAQKALINNGLFGQPICCQSGRTSTTINISVTGVASTTPMINTVANTTTGYNTQPLIPRRLLFGNPDKQSVQISPNGTLISYLAPVDGILKVWVGKTTDPASAQPVTHNTNPIHKYKWAYTNNHILYQQDQDGDENWRIISHNLTTNQTKILTPPANVKAYIEGGSPKFPNEILVGLNDRDPKLHDIHRLNIDTGETTLVLKNDGFIEIYPDDDYNIRYVARMTPSGGIEIVMPTNDGNWKPVIKIPMQDSLTTSLKGFDKTGQIIYLQDSRHRNTAALFALDIKTDQQTLLAENPLADVSDLMLHPTEKNIQAVAFTYERKHWQILDQTIAKDFSYLKTVADGEIKIVSRTLDDQHWIVVYEMDNGPVRYYHYHRQAQKARFLFTNRQELENRSLAKMHSTVIQSRDGLNLVSYYTLPNSSVRNGKTRPEQPLPMVLHVHGGPWDRYFWGYHPLHQWLANRGYAVMSVNFRGSTGFGKAFINAANRQWGAAMHNDLIDAVDWAVREGIAEPTQVAIIGASYGGYATLIGLTLTPLKFACGIDIVGPSNLVTLLETLPPYWETQISLFITRVGDHTTEKGRAFLTERSPLTYVDQIQKPLLIGQGANDPRVKQSESEQIIQAMQQKNIPVTYMLYPDEGHGFEKPENTLSSLAVIEAFLANCLGGRCQPIGDDFEGSSITIPVGKKEIPGLEKALSK